jgi:hypothetical protein
MQDPDFIRDKSELNFFTWYKRSNPLNTILPDSVLNIS